MAQATTDPITQVYQAIAKGLNAFSGFTNLVRLQINLTDPAWSTVDWMASYPRGQGDLPLLTLAQGTFRIRPFGKTSNVSTINAEYPLLTLTDTLGNVTPNQLLYNANTALYQINPDSPDLGLTTFTGGILGGVSDWEVRQGGFRMDKSSGDKRIMAVCSVAVEMNISRDYLASL